RIGHLDPFRIDDTGVPANDMKPKRTVLFLNDHLVDSFRKRKFSSLLEPLPASEFLLFPHKPKARYQQSSGSVLRSADGRSESIAVSLAVFDSATGHRSYNELVPFQILFGHGVLLSKEKVPDRGPMSICNPR